jgi:hypothetical protein
MKLTIRYLVAGIALWLGTASHLAPATAQSYAPAATEDGGRDGTNLPAGTHVEKHVRRGWVIAGSIVFGVAYGLGLVSAASQDSSSPSKWLAIPVVGPWIALGALGSYDEAACDRNSSSSSKICPSKSGAQEAYPMLGIGQLAGIGMVLGGVLLKRTEIVPDVIVEHEVTVAPFYASHGPGGLAVAGRF